MGSSPQTVINRQVADQSDLVVGVFWTRLGTPTADAESGTAEEIGRAGEAGKPVMLYFSKAKIDPDAIDLEEYKKLKDFKLRKFPEGLIEHYNSLNDFRDKFSRQLWMKVRDLVARDVDQTEALGKNTAPKVNLAIAQGNPPHIFSSPAVLHLAQVTCTDQNEIPDYAPSSGDFGASPSNARPVIMQTVTSASFDRDYYRKLVDYYRRAVRYQPIRIAVTNFGDDGVHDLYLELRLRGTEEGFEVRNSSITPPRPEALTVGYSNFGMFEPLGIEAPLAGSVVQVQTPEAADEWRMNLDFPVVQPRRTVVSRNEFYLGATRSMEIILNATAYSSSSTPFVLEFIITLDVQERNLSFRDILSQLDVQFL